MMRYLLLFLFLATPVYAQTVFVKPSLTLSESTLLTKVVQQKTLTRMEARVYVAMLNKYLAGRMLAVKSLRLTGFNSLLIK